MAHSTTARKKQQKFSIKANTSIGRSAAEDDSSTLHECFVTTDLLADVLDTSSSKSIILGRTGSGKSAAIMYIKKKETNIIEIKPENLALNYISNSDIISFFEKLGLKLDNFYQLLWRHVLCVELLNFYFHKKNKDKFRLKNWLYELVEDSSSKKKAIEYLEKWGTSFWADTEERIKEITENLENELAAGTSIDIEKIKCQLSSRYHMSSEEKTEIIYKAQKVINSVQLQNLSEVMSIINENIFDKQKERYFILIDRLDEGWVDDQTRYKLIRALIETVKKFRTIQNVKIVIALRVDLLERVYNHTRDSGFQEEKYEDLNINVRWTKDKLVELVERRIFLSMTREYDRDDLRFRSLFPDKVGKEEIEEFLTSRTMMRPRDIISFVNLIFRQAEGRDAITESIVREAEGLYSERRLRALCDEWIVDHKYLNIYCDTLKNKSIRFSLLDITDEDIEEFCIGLIENDDSEVDYMTEWAKRSFASSDWKLTRNELLRTLYKIGVVGIKLESHYPFMFIQDDQSELSSSQIETASRFQVHPMLWRALGSFELK